MKCTNCNGPGPFPISDIFYWNVPYRLCKACYREYDLLDDHDKEQFGIRLWQKGAVQSLKPLGSA